MIAKLAFSLNTQVFHMIAMFDRFDQFRKQIF